MEIAITRTNVRHW